MNKHSIKKKQHRNAATKKKKTTVQIDRMQTYDMNEGFKFNTSMYKYI